MPASRAPSELFDALADEYDDMRRELGWDPFPHVEAACVGVELAGADVLDVGCGTGEVAAWLAARGAHVVGVDVSDRMCVLAAARAPGARFLCADVGAGLPFADGAFDLVLAQGCLEYVPDQRRALAELARLAAGHGRVLAQVELAGPDTPNGEARAVGFLDEWTRYRMSAEELSRAVGELFAEAEVTPIEGYVLEDEGVRVRYGRVIGRPRGGGR